MYYLGIDGGGTKTKYTLGDENGNIVTSIVEPTCHYLQVGLDNVSLSLEDGINKICKKANITRNDIASAFVGTAGYGDIKSDNPLIEKAIKKGLMDIKHVVGNDGENALAGALCGKDGINIVCGTGSIAFGKNTKLNRVLSCGGWHHALGSDEGSGYWLSIELIKEFFRQADGRDDKTKLYQKVYDYLSLSENGEIIKILVENWQLDRTKIASLSRLVDELYLENDQYAINIVNDAVNKLSEIIIALYKKLEFENTIDVTYTGGIFKMGDKILVPLKDKLKQYNMNLIPPTLEPDIGSLILAYQSSGIEITDMMITNLKK